MKVLRYDSKVSSLSVPTVAAPNIPIPAPSTAGDIQAARDFQDLGAAIGKAGSQLVDRIQQRQEMDFKQQSADLRTDFSQKLDQKLMSTDMETVTAQDGSTSQRPVGLLNWQGNNAVGAHKEFERYVDELAPSYINQIKNPKYQKEFATDIFQIKEQKGSSVLRHEANEWNTAKTDSFKNSIAQAVKDGNIASGDKAARDFASFQGIEPEPLIKSTRNDVVRNSAITRLEASPDGSQSLSYLDMIEGNKIIDAEEVNKIRKDVKTYSKSLMAEKKLEQEASQSANFVKLVDGVMSGNVGIINSDSISQMSASGDLPKGAGEALQNFLDISKLSTDGSVNSLGLDESVVNHARAVLSISKPGDLNQAIMDIMNDDKMTTEEGRKRAVVLLQVAKELGTQKNSDARKNADDSLKAVMSWYDKVDVPASQGVLEFMKQIRAGVKPIDAAQQTIQQELVRQSAGKDKDAVLLGTMFDVIDGRGHYADLLPAFNAFFIKSGMEEPEAAQAANSLIMQLDPNKVNSEQEFMQNFAQAMAKVAPGVNITANLQERVQRKVEQKHLINMIALDKSPAMDKFRAEHPYLYATAISVQDMGVAGAYFLDGLTANIPSYILSKYGYDIPAPASGGGKALAGLGSLGGFVTGLPGKVGRGISSLVFGEKAAGKLIAKGVEAGGKTAATTKIATNVAKSSLELGAMTATVTPQSGFADWRERGKQFVEGSETGAAFGALGVISSAKYPKITTAIRMGISALWTGLPSHMAKQSVEEQIFQIGLGMYFGAHGIDFKEVKAFKNEAVEMAKEVKDPVGKEAIANTVRILDNMNEATIVEKAKALKAEIPKQFVTGNEGALFDYLSLYVDPNVLVRMTPSQRLQLGNMDWQQLRDTIDSGTFNKPQGPGGSPAPDKSGFPADPNAPGASPSSGPLKNSANGGATSRETSGGGTAVAEAPAEDPAGAAVPASSPAPEVPAAAAVPAKPSAAKEAPAPESPPMPKESGKSGKTDDKPYGLAKTTMERAVEKGLAEDLGHIETYKERPILKEKAKEVAEFASKEWERAKQIALGHDRKTPEGLSISEIYSGVRSIAENKGDIELIRELASSEPANEIAKSAGQFVKGYDAGGTGTGTTKMVREVAKAREAVVEKKLAGKDVKKEVKKEVEAIKAEKKKSAPKIKEWSDFIESLKC